MYTVGLDFLFLIFGPTVQQSYAMTTCISHFNIPLKHCETLVSFSQINVNLEF